MIRFPKRYADCVARLRVPGGFLIVLAFAWFSRPSPQSLAYGLPSPATPAQILQISENWRPYRTWVTLLLRTQLEYETGEITGRQGHARTG